MANFNEAFFEQRVKIYFKAFMYNVINKDVTVDLRTPLSVIRAYEKFCYNGSRLNPLYKFNSLVEKNNCNDSLDERDQFSRLTSSEKFSAFLMDPQTMIMISKLRGANGERLKIQVPKNACTQKEIMSISEMIDEGRFTADMNDPNTYWCNDDSDIENLTNIINNKDNYCACRNANGNGPVMIIQYPTKDGITSWTNTEQHKIAAIYHMKTRTGYYDARPCKLSYWLDNEDTRYSTFGN